MIGKIVQVEWTDIACVDDINEYESLHLLPAEAVSYGRLLVYDEEKIIILGTEFVDGTRREVICFPRSAVKNIKEVK